MTMAKLLGEPFVPQDPEAQKHFAEFTKAITEWHEAATAQVKDALGAALGSVAGDAPTRQK
jgi:hypothetical protein